MPCLYAAARLGRTPVRWYAGVTLLNYWSSTGRPGQPFTRKLGKTGTVGFASMLQDASSTNHQPKRKAAVAVRLQALKYSTKSRFAVLLERRFFYNFCSTACALCQFA